MTDSTQTNQFLNFLDNNKIRPKKQWVEFYAMVKLCYRIIRNFLKILSLTNENVKYLFDRYNDFLIGRNIPKVLDKHSKIAKNKIVLEDLQSTSWQYLVHYIIIATERKKYLKTTTKKEAEIVKDLKEIYKILMRVQNSTYSNFTEQFKSYLESLPIDEIDQF